MAGTMEFSKLFDNSDYSSLPEELKNKIENHVSIINKDLEELRSKHEKLRVNSEQQYCEIEKQLIDSNTKLAAESSSNVELKEKVADLEKNYNEASTKLKDVQETQDGSLSTQLRLTRVNEQLEGEKRDFAMLLEKRNKEIDSLNEELKELSRKNSEMNMSKCEALAKLDEINSNQVNKEFQIKRLTQEKENLQKQIEWLDKDLNEKTKELMTVRREKSTALLEVQSKLEEKTEECSLQQATIEALKKTNTDQSTKIDTFIQRIKDIQDSNSQSEEQFRQEIQARVRLLDLYKNAAEEAESKSTQLTGAVTELRDLLKDSAAAHTEMEEEKDQAVARMQEEINDRERRIESLEQELVNANDLLSALKSKNVSEEKVESMFPTAAATSKMLKSGMTLTQIYNEYVQATDGLQLEKEENKRLNSYLDQILQEIEEKAPMLKKQREDYEIALKSIDQMTRQLDTSMLDCQTLRAEADESHRKSSHLTKENLKQQQQIHDLSDQVKFLVKEVEELQGGRVVRDEVSSAEVSSSSRLITDKLVTFRNIEELQEQNQKLLTVIRELSDKQEEEESSAIDSRTRELRDRLEVVQEELTEVQDGRNRQAEMIESIVRQRDMYRVLLQQAGSSSVPLSGSFAANTSGAKSPGAGLLKSPEPNKKYEETSQALKQLQEEFTQYRKEKLENERIQNEQIDKMRQSTTDLRVQNTKLSSQLDFASERYKVLQGNADGYRKEIATYRDRLQKYTTSVAKHEQTINTLREEIMSTQERLAQAQSRLENVRAEKDMIRSSETRLAAELDSLRRERHSQTMLMANLQAIQNNLERNEYETKQRIGKQVETLEREKLTLKRRLESEEKQHRTAVALWERQVQESRGQVEMEMKNHQKTKDLQVKTHKQLQDMQAQLVSATTKLASAESRLSNLSAEESGLERTNEEVRDLKSQLEQGKAEFESVQGQLQKARQHADQYKTIADGVQQTIKEQNQASEEFKETLEERLREAVERREQLEERVENMESERQELLNENLRIIEESHKLNADLRKQLSSIQNEHQEVVERRKTAIALEISAKQECEQQTKLAAEAQDKYERELMLHAADVEALSAVKKQLEGFNARLIEKEEQARIAEQKLAENKTSWVQREKLLTDAKDKLSARVSDLLAQTRALHEQMGKLSSQVVSVQERASTSGGVRTGRGQEDDSAKSSDQLLEVVRYLRKEKDIAEGKLDVVETECSRLKQRCENLEKQLESCNTELAEERQQIQTDMQTAAQHAELMHKVDSYNLLHDSNKLLRDEKQQLQAQLVQLEAKLSKLEETICPLQSETRELQAQKDGLLLDKKSNQAEMERWRTRTSQLIEQSHKTDPEEHKRLVQEREEMRKQVNNITDEMHKAKSEATKSSLEMAKLQRQISILKEEQAKLSKEMKTTKDELEEKTKDANEKIKTINQLKKIGRKYKEQAENTSKEFEDYKNLHKGDEEQKQSVQHANNEQIQALEHKLKESEAKYESLETNLKDIEGKRNELEKSITEAGNQKSQLEQSLKESETKRAAIEQQLTTLKNERDQIEHKTQSVDTMSSKLRTDLSQLHQELNKTKEDNDKLKEDKVELDKKLARANNVLLSAKNKLASMKEINEKLTSERLEMKKKLATTEQQSSDEAEKRIAAMKVMFENQTRKLEQDLEAKEGLQKENSELQTKIQHLLKQIESSQKLGTPQPQVATSRSVGAISTERTSSSPSEAPKTANIRPIASSPAGIKPQTVPVQPQSAASKVTASIRPMAIAPTSVSPMATTSGTPTATVMPTTAAQQEVNVEVITEEVSTPVQQLFPQQSVSGRPTQQVQRVIPTQDLGQESVNDSTTETGIVEPQPSSSRETPIAPLQQTNKRQREDTESPGEDSIVKRTKVTTEETLEIPEITVTDEDATQVFSQSVQDEELGGADQFIDDGTLVNTDVEVIDTEDILDDETIEDDGTQSTAENDDENQEGEEEEEEEEEDDPVIIVNTSDEENDDQDGDDDCEEDEEEEEEGDGDDGYTQEGPEETYEHEEGHDDVDIYEDIGGDMDVEGFSRTHDDDMQSRDGQQEQDDDDVEVVIIDEDDLDAPMESTEPESQPSSQPSSQQNQNLLPPIQPERQLSVGSRNNLTPFMIGGHPSGFEDVDDCTVPSTPTLNVPRRVDGFAEAVSSPQVSQRFIFGSGGEQGLTLSGLAQLDAQAVLGMGMDDTRMDLSQLEEGSGRSVPSTPLHTSAPVTLISEVSETSQQESTVVTSQSELDTQGEEDQGEVQLEEEDQEGEDEEDLVGDLGVEDSQDGDLDPGTEDKQHADVSGDAAEASTSRDEMPSSPSNDRSQDAGKPKIQKIVWDARHAQMTASQAPVVGQPIQSIGTVTQQYRPARGGIPQRGTPTTVRGGNRGGFPRGQSARRSMRGRGGMYPRRPY